MPVVTGDTKVMEKGQVAGAVVNTSGIGARHPRLDSNLDEVRRHRPCDARWLTDSNVAPGDAIILTGSVGDHGIALLSFREGYQFESELVSDGDAPSGNSYVTFANSEPGRGCRALQGFGVDGRQVQRLKVTLYVRGEDIRPGIFRSDLPSLVVTFYDENRDTVGKGSMGPWRGSFAWQRQTATIDVPSRAREAILRIGLFGAMGEISFDAIELEAERDD